MFRIFDQYVSLKTLFLVFGDTASIAVSIWLAYWLRYWNDAEGLAYFLQQPNVTVRGLTIIAIFQVCAYYNELYRVEFHFTTSDQFFRLAQAIGIGCFFLAAIYYAAPQLSVGRGVFALTLLLVLISTTAFRRATDLVWSSALPPVPVLIVGTDDVARSLGEEIKLRDDLGMHLVGFAGLAGPSDLPAKIIGEFDDIEDLVSTHGVRTVLVCDTTKGDFPINALFRLRTRGIHVEDARAALAAFTGRISLETVRSRWFVFSEGFSRSGYAMAFKRLTDVTLGTVGLLLSLPIMVVVAVAIRLDSQGPALFLQQRTGLNGNLFEVLKFRTMRIDAEVDGVAQFATEGDPRITRVGKHLRRYRLDELPQFINVILGHMSVVGPRPERPEFISQILQVEPLYDERHTLRPGLTGWAQVCYRYGANLEDSISKLEYDLFYLKNVSFLFDMAIILQTVKIVLWGRGR